MSTFVVVAVVFAGLVAFGVRSLVLASRRRAAMKAWGDANGFAYVRGPLAADKLGFGDLACMRQGDKRRARNVLEGRWNGRRALVLDLSWRVGSGEDAERHERLVAIVEGRASPEAAAAATAGLGPIISTTYEADLGITLRVQTTVRIGRSSGPAPSRSEFELRVLRAAPQIECGVRALAVVAAKRTPPEEIGALLDLAETAFASPSAAATPVAPPTAGVR